VGFYPLNPNIPAARGMQSDVPGLNVTYGLVARYALTAAEAATADVDYFVVSVDMKVGDYTLAATTMPGNCARNVTVTQTATSTEDTNGTITIEGTDLAGESITETLTPDAGVTVAGLKAFRTVTKATGAGWAAVAGADKITIGFGDVIGLPDLLPCNTVLLAAKGGVREATAPAVTASATVLAENTVDLNSALDGSAVDIYYVV
jgi:hypothetical protein